MASTATLTIDVNNVNDNDPIFSSTVLNFYYYENRPVGQLDQIKATDQDKADIITYTIQSGNGDGKFSLNAVSKT